MRFVIILCVLTLSILDSRAAVAQETRPLRISARPTPERPADYGTLDAIGTVMLKIEFLANGKIGEVIPLRKMPVSDLTELAVDAAKRIEFEPEVKNGKPVGVSKIILYSYSWEFGGWKGSPNFIALVDDNKDEQAEAIIQKAVQALGGDKYLNVKTQVGRGKFSIIKDGVTVSFQRFIDVIVLPDKERTEFRGSNSRLIQTNDGDTGWVYDGDMDLIKIQSEKQIENFKRGMRASIDNLLRGHWRGSAKLTYVGRRPATLGKRNEVVKLTYDDGHAIEFEFAADDGTPQKAIQRRMSADDVEVVEEDRYAQFVDIGGIRFPFIIDRFSSGTRESRINYESVEFNVTVPDSIFAKPSDTKSLKKDLKL